MVEAGVPGNPQEPLFDGVRGVDPADVPVRPEIDILGQVLGVGRVARDPRQIRKTFSLQAIISSKSFASSSVGITCPCSYGKTIQGPRYSIPERRFKTARPEDAVVVAFFPRVA